MILTSSLILIYFSRDVAIVNIKAIILNLVIWDNFLTELSCRVWWLHCVSGALGELTVRCPEIRVSRADYANCNGVYSITNSSVLWSPLSPVYKHNSRDRSDHQSHTSHSHIITLICVPQINFLSLNLNNELGSSSGMPVAWDGQ